MTSEEISDLEFLQGKYRERGYVVFSCWYPKDIGEIFKAEDSFLYEYRWKVIGESSAEDMMVQLRNNDNIQTRPFFYRAEATD